MSLDRASRWRLSCCCSVSVRRSPRRPISRRSRSSARICSSTRTCPTPAGQSCATCHAPAVGFTGPDSDDQRHGRRLPGRRRRPLRQPQAARGGLRRATARSCTTTTPRAVDRRHVLGRPRHRLDARRPARRAGPGSVPEPARAEQRRRRAWSCDKVQALRLRGPVPEVWGTGRASQTWIAPTSAIARSIAAYERSAEVNPFTSKYDCYLKGEAQSDRRRRSGASRCSRARPSAPPATASRPNGEPPLFTDFTYDNLGVPKNPANPFYTMPAVQPGRDATGSTRASAASCRRPATATSLQAEMGKHKVPTLRNVDKRPSPAFVKAYGHNGYFKSLEEIVHFYNTRDVRAGPGLARSRSVARTINDRRTRRPRAHATRRSSPSSPS